MEELSEFAKEQMLSSVKVPRPIFEIDQREVPIDQDDIARFRDWFCTTPEDELLFSKIMSRVRMISNEDSDDAFDAMEHAIMSFVGDDEYDLVVDSEGKSGDLVIQKLNLNSKSPKHIYRYGAIPTDNQENRKIVIADDAAYSSERLRMMATEAQAALGVTSENILICTIAATTHAEQTLRDQGYRVAGVSYRIPTVGEEFSREEIARYIKKMNEGGLNLNEEGYLLRVLTFLESKVPDNFLPGLRRTKAVLLFDDESDNIEQLFVVNDTETGIWPPYRKR